MSRPAKHNWPALEPELIALYEDGEFTRIIAERLGVPKTAVDHRVTALCSKGVLSRRPRYVPPKAVRPIDHARVVAGPEPLRACHPISWAILCKGVDKNNYLVV